MLRHKNIDRLCCVILALTLLLSTVFVGAAASGVITEDTIIGYETRLFDQSRVHTIDIVMDDWDAFLQTCTSEEYSACHLVIDGESYKNVAIRGKGNTSLSNVASYGNNRYSFKVEFDHYQTGATYHGLDKLSLNNLIQDNTYMKDYFAYTLMNKMGVAAPLCSFVQVNVNGEAWGLYLAVEGVEDAFLQRNYGKSYGELYKPDSMSFGGGRGNGRDFDMDEMAEKFGFSFGGEDGETSTFTMPQMPDGEMPTMPTGGTMPDMSTMPQMPSGEASTMPTGGTTSDKGSMPQMLGGEAPTMPTNGTTSDKGTMPQMPSGEAPTMPTGGTMPDMSSMPQMPGGEAPTMPTGSTTSDKGGMPQMPSGEATTMPTNGTMPDMSTMPQMPDNFDPSKMGGDFQRPDGFGGGGGSMGSDDVKLIYTDDDPDSYSNIFSSAKTDVTEADQARLIASLKALGEGDTSVVDTEAVIRYMAVHNFLCNDDSYTGMMVHNYYLYEEDGVLAMIPWDYNLAYGTMSGSNATSSVNADIDQLVSAGGSSGSDRPMAAWIMASEEYMAQYHAVYQEFMTTVFDSGWFASEIDRVTAMISPYVAADPTAFCTYEEFLTGAETLRQFCLKRAESVSSQLKGENARVDASALTLSDMGTMSNMGGGHGMGGEEKANRGRSREIPTKDAAPDASEETGAAAPAAETQGGSKPERPDFTGGLEPSGISRNTSAAQGWVWAAACAALLGAALLLAGKWNSHR